MADLPIPFTAPMVCAILREILQPGTGKTQTRRDNHLKRLRHFGAITEFGCSDTTGYDWHFRNKRLLWNDIRHDRLLDVLPWKKGDRLYVREAWRAQEAFDHLAPSKIRQAFEKQHGETLCPVRFEAEEVWNGASEGFIEQNPAGRLRPGMFMPRWASRITLTVTDVRVQRLQDISNEDAIAEGIEQVGMCGRDPKWKHYPNGSEAGGWLVAWESYRTLWNAINGPGAWDENPWVAAYSFTSTLTNIDSLPK